MTEDPPAKGNLVDLQNFRRARSAAVQAAADGDPPLVDRLAAILSDIVDEPLLVLHDAARPRPLELRLSHFKPELAERAAELLEEAGW